MFPLSEFPIIYPITDTGISLLSHLEQFQQFARGGAAMVQIRDKAASSAELYSSVAEVCRSAQKSGVLVIVNDRVDIAIAAGAKGVHLGQHDLPPEQARRLLGKDAVIGFSTHSPGQARAAASLPVDYIAIGPVFPTETKRDPDPVVGLEGIADAKSAVGKIPLVAIGGIGHDNFRSVLAAGADSVAVISAVLKDPSGIGSATSRFLV